MKLNLNINLQSLDGTEIPESNAGKLVGNLLAQDNKGDALKKFAMAQKLYKGEELDIDASDALMLKSFIEQSESMTVLAKAQILVLFK